LLGRAKWDSWKKREKLTKYQSQEAYVETLLSILRNFSDRPQAVQLLKELRDYGKDRIGRQQEEYEDVTSSSSIRSASPPPETAGSRRSFHSAQPGLTTSSSTSSRLGHPPRYEQEDYIEEGEETPRKVRQAAAADPHRRQQRGGQQDEHYTDEDDQEYSESDTASEDDGHPRQYVDQRMSTSIQTIPAQSRLSQTAPSVQRFSGPSPYQHPAQYPAPIDFQLPVNLPPGNPTIPQNSVSHQSSSSTVLPYRRGDRPAGPPSAVPSVNTLPPGALYRQQSAPFSAGPSKLDPNVSRPAAPSPTLDRALDSIQTSLAALHERLNLIESSQSQIARR